MLYAFSSQVPTMMAFQDASGLPWFVLMLCLGVTAPLGFLGWVLYRLVQNLDHRAALVDQRLAELGEQTRLLADAVQGLGTGAAEQNRALIEAVSKISIAAGTAATVQAQQPAAATSKDTSDAPEKPEPAAAGATDAALKEALHLLARPDEQYPDHLLKARELLLPLVDGPNSSEVYTALSETLFWLGDISESKTEQEQYHGEGVAHGKHAVALAPDSVAANLWYAANMGSHGMARGIMSSLFYLGDIEKHGKKAMALDKGYFHGAPLRLMGRFYHQCPGWPIGSGDKAKAIKVLEEAVAEGPEFFLNGLYLAEVLIDKRKKSEARKVLNTLINSPEPKVMPLYQERVRATARRLVAKT